jgi:hypothetical protein
MQQAIWYRQNGLRVSAAGLLGVLAFVPAAFAGQPVTQTLSPPAPSWLSCKAVGDGTICDGTRVVVDSSEDSGIVCGNGPDAFDIWSSGIDHVHAIRYYDADGQLSRRIFEDRNSAAEAAFFNPLTGAVVPYTQHNTTVDVFAVPGDLNTQTRTETGENIYFDPSGGAVFLNAGRTITGPTGDEEFAVGPHSFDAFFGGDNSILQPLCAALGAI